MGKQKFNKIIKVMTVLFIVIFVFSVSCAARDGLYKRDKEYRAGYQLGYKLGKDLSILRFSITKTTHSYQWGMIDGYEKGKKATINEILSTHNKYRQEVGVSPLVWDDKLAADARSWTYYLNINKILPPQHSKLGHGENIYVGGGSWTNAIDRWASEKKCFKNGYIPETYNHNRQCNDISTTCKDKQNWRCTGHYTQVVWKKTQKVGCGKSGAYVVCEYEPPGNTCNYNIYDQLNPNPISLDECLKI